MGCAFGVIWLLAVASIVAIVVEDDPRMRVRSLGLFIGSIGLASIWGMVSVLRTGQFFWAKMYGQYIMLDWGIVERDERPVAFWLFVLLLGVLALLMLGLAVWVILHPEALASRSRS
jgi:hypothetical protein